MFITLDGTIQGTAGPRGDTGPADASVDSKVTSGGVSKTLAGNDLDLGALPLPAIVRLTFATHALQRIKKANWVTGMRVVIQMVDAGGSVAHATGVSDGTWAIIRIYNATNLDSDVGTSIELVYTSAGEFVQPGYPGVTEGIV